MATPTPVRISPATQEGLFVWRLKHGFASRSLTTSRRGRKLRCQTKVCRIAQIWLAADTVGILGGFDCCAPGFARRAGEACKAFTLTI